MAIYMMDFDRIGRAATVELLDGDSGAVLDTRNLLAYADGKYLVWDIKGHVKIRVTRTAGKNAAS